MEKKLLHEMLDACRPATDVPADPELAALAVELQQNAEARAILDRSQRLDVALGRAFREVSVPDGLAERLLAALKPEPEATDSILARQPESVPGDDVRPMASKESRTGHPRHRRAWLFTGAAALAGCLLTLLYWNSRERLPTTGQEILAAVDQWNSLLREDQWQPAESAPLAELPDRSGLRLPIQRWQWALRSRVACYEFAPSARLFVMRSRPGTDLPAQPPPGYPVGDWHVGAWQSGGFVYVLAVTDDAEGASVLYRRITGRRGVAA